MPEPLQGESGPDASGGNSDGPPSEPPIPGDAVTESSAIPDSALWLGEDDFAPLTETSAGPLRKPGPGLPESVGWMAGMFGLQLLGGVIAFVAVILLYRYDTGFATRAGDSLRSVFDQQTLTMIQREYVGILFGIIQLVTVAGTMLAVALRFGRNRKRQLPLKPIPWRHVALILLAMIPLVVLSGQLMVGATWFWQQFTDLFPVFKSVDKVSSMDAVKKLADRTSLLGLLLMVAVAPAIAEELVFRGVIGRGLIARWGFPAGVVMTSLLFAAMHLHPPHVVALIPLSLFLHVVYLSTRSFYAPMLLHFLNNALAVVALKVATVLLESVQTIEEPRISFLLLGCSGLCVVLLMRCLWKSRVEFIQPDGTEWSPGYPSVAWPDAEIIAWRRCRPTAISDWAWAGVGLGMFALGIVLFGILAHYGRHA